MADDPTFAEVFAEDLWADSSEPAAPRLDPDQVFTDDGDDGPVGVHTDRGRPVARFDGDTSGLPAEVCWTLQELVASPHVTEDSRKYWPVVLQYEQVLRSRLSELGLVLEINHEYRYAFTRQAEDPSPHSRTILRSKTLSLAASALVLYLYNRYVVSPEDPIIDRGDMVEHMLAYRPATDTDEVLFRRKIDAAILHLQPEVLKPVRGSNDRFVIYPVVTALVTAEQVTALDARYRAIVRGERVHAVSDEGEEPA